MSRLGWQDFPVRRFMVAAALITGVLLIASCSAGQVTQTDTQVAAVNGASGDTGAIAVRNAQLVFPAAGAKYKPGDTAPMIVTIVNNGEMVDKLVSVSSPLAGRVDIDGDVTLEARSAVAVYPTKQSSVSPTNGSPSAGSATPTTPSANGSQPNTTSINNSSTRQNGTTANSNSSRLTTNSATSPTQAAANLRPGQLIIIFRDLTGQLRPGETTQVTFTFEKAGQLTLNMPIGTDPHPRPHSEQPGH